MKAEKIYKIGDEVRVVPLEKNGRVVSVWITATGIKTEVRYFDNAEPKTTYFFSDEIEPSQGERRQGTLGYQPTQDHADPDSPPQGGSGVPR